MSREFDLIQQSVKAKKDGVAQETRSRGVIFQTEEDLFEQKAMQNKSIFENAGIVRLFQELIDNGTVKYSDKPVMSEGEYVRTGRFFHRLKWVEPKVILPYTPAKIEWHKTTDYIEKYDNTSVSLVFNGDRHYSSPSAELNMVRMMQLFFS
jgi:hypothetical protein